MDTDDSFSTFGFARTFAVPLALVFVVPVIGLWFFDHAEATLDGLVRADVLTSIESDPELDDAEREQLREGYATFELSALLVSEDPEAQEFARSWPEGVRADYRQFRWGKRIAGICLGSALGAIFLSLGFVAASLRSQTAQYYALTLNWQLLKLVCVLQIVGQGILWVGLSYWVTVLWFELYVPKLILLVGALAVLAAGALLKATFSSRESTFAIVGRRLDPETSPELFDKVSGLCRDLQIEAPDQIVAGIDDNFFVTECPVTVLARPGDEAPRRFTGKTLFVSVSLLKRLERDEADAILAHEMGHFSAEDTTFSRKISPLLERYRLYLEALYENGLSRPVFYFMLFFWSLYQLSLSRLSRSREFQADRLAAKLTAPDSVARALVKVGAYSAYRGRVEEELFQSDDLHPSVEIRAQVETGFSAFVAATDLRAEVFGARTPHPFDTHPPLDERLSNVGLPEFEIDPDALTRPAEDSWFGRLGDAEQLERDMWEDYEGAFKELHAEALASRLTPTEDWQLELVERFFPVQTIRTHTGQTYRFDWQEMHYSEWSAPLRYDSVEALSVVDGLLRVDPRGGRTREINLNRFGSQGGKLLDTLQRYYARHLRSADHARQRSRAEWRARRPGRQESDA